MWFRRDLRLTDNQALAAALDLSRPIIPVFIHDEVVEGQGAAPKFRLGLSVASLSQSLKALGSQLVLRRGNALTCLRSLVEETGATSVVWTRSYDPASKDRDIPVKAGLKDDGITVESFPGHILFEPWTVETQTGGYYRVYTPFWKSVRDRDVPDMIGAPSRLPTPDAWPDSDALDDWQMDAAMNRGASVVKSYCKVGETAAHDRLAEFIENRVRTYKDKRDYPAIAACSGLSENLTYGEISPRALWHAGRAAMDRIGEGGEHFVKEVVWREFSYHLVHHTPQITTRNWREDWDAFPWNTDDSSKYATAWKQGRTGIRFVDAAMREMYVTGTMHNRSRMNVASYLTKHLMTHWQIGQRWFEDCLIDWDPAANAMGWQWAAGSGPDAAPYFRIFNPVTQLEKFDADKTYQKRWIAEGYRAPTETALSYFDAIPESWGLAPDQIYPAPIVTAKDGREKALEAYQNRGF